MSKKENPSAVPPGSAGSKPKAGKRNAQDAGSGSPGSPVKRGQNLPNAPERQPGEPLVNPRHEEFCQAVADGYSGTQAYRMAISKECLTETAMQAASRMLAERNISARVAELRKSFREILEQKIGWKQETVARYLVGVVETPLSEVHTHSPLCQEWSRTDGAGSSSERIKMPSKLEALNTLNKMAGWYEPEKAGASPVTVVVRIGGTDHVED